ncbi:ECM29 [[Candida] subhashii]|uniref:ECM29 n=1 Tax=[Candida] subhashii TaxID=561895 RepID=A0A8J5QQV3_9ASCO|nr:ECM29 [[Candida] subhashii]KAG7665679.1 ECM29 [[Candida] subhashii]
MAESELSLINKVELRIALASDDTQFEHALSLYLAPVLLKLASPHAEVRKTVLKIVQHLIPRITASRNIKLPVNALIKQVKVPSVKEGVDTSSVRLYSTLFIIRGIDRLTDEEKSLLVPEVVQGIHLYPNGIRARMFSILCKLLQSWKTPFKGTQEYDNMRKVLQFDENLEDERFLAFIMSKFLLLLPDSASKATPGLSIEDNAFFTTEAGVTYKTKEEVVVTKRSILEFLKAGFSNEQLALPLLIASADPLSTIGESAEVLFKKLNVDFDSISVFGGISFIDHIVGLYLGESAPPVDSSLQYRILQVLVKSNQVRCHSQISKITTLALNSDNSRVRQLAIELISWLGKSETMISGIEKYNQEIATKLRDGILAEGWPSMETQGSVNYSIRFKDRQSKYEALGNILKSSPDLFYEDWSYVEFLFESLEGDSADFRIAIQDALSGLSVHLSNLSESQKSSLKELSRRYLAFSRSSSVNTSACRYMAIKYINAAFPFEDPLARFFCVLGTAKENSPDTIEESQNGLHPHWFNLRQANNSLEFRSTSYLLGQETTVTFPSFESFINTLVDEIESSKRTGEGIIFQALPKAIEFSEQILVMGSIKDNDTVVIADQDWAIRVEKAVEMNEKVRKLIAERMKAEDIQTPVCKLMSICIDALTGQFINSTSIVSHTSYGTILARLLSFASSPAIAMMIPRIPDLFELLDSKVFNDLAVEQICKAIGIIASHPENDDASIESIFKRISFEDMVPHKIKGRVLCSSYLISRLILRDRIGVVSSSILQSLLECLEKMLKESGLYYIALDSISQLCMFGTLGPIINQDLINYIEKFREIIRAKVKKIDERSVLALGYLTLTSERQITEEMTEDEQIIYDTHISKQIEYIFTSSEALLLASAGWDSKLLDKQLDIQGESVKYISRDTSRVEIILKTVLKACSNTKPSLRKAGCIWLLSLVQYCGHLEVVRSRAPELHVSFMRFLADKDELIQESASRGLGLVYEMGDVELKDTLVKSLLKSFTQSSTTAKFTAGTVEEDTELFEPDLLRTNEGSVSTYKDVLNLAQDVGDPSLVYKFMSLAKSSTLWSSRKGIAFGLESILSQTSLDKLLANNQNLADRLIPKLFRYRYDPNIGVSKSMNDIWNALVKDTSKAVVANFNTILSELLSSMGKKEWRTRQASTAALNDLLQMVELDQYESKLDDIWTMSFRAMDDIKESVRKEGIKLTKSLATNLTTMFESNRYSNKTEKISSILQFLIPFFLGNKGLLSDSQEVRDFALATLLKLCKSGNKAIKVYVPELIENFINLFSSLEPQFVNYLVLNASKYNIESNVIDATRLKNVGNSPLMEAIESLLGQLDEETLPDLVRRLETCIKKGVGLPTKVSGSRVLVSLITNQYELIKPYGDKLLQVSSSQMKDRNDTVASSYAAASGYLCRIAKVDTIVKYSEKITKMYFESAEVGDDRSRILASIASESVSRYAGDRFDIVASAFLPLAYIGKFDSNKQVVNNFDKEWIEHTSGSKSTVKLYLIEILDFIQRYLKSNEFAVRKTLAKALSDLCTVIDNLNQFSDKVINEILELLLESNKGKSWDGKELVFESLVSFAIMSKSYISKHEDILQAINKTVVVEAKRRNKEYQKHAILTLGKYIHEFHENEEIVEVYIEIMTKVLSDKYWRSDYNDDDDSDEEMEDGDRVINTKENIELEEKRLVYIQNFVDVFYTDPEFNPELFNFIFEQLNAVFNSSLIENTWRSKLQATEVYKKILTELETKKISSDQCKVLLNSWKVLQGQCLNIRDIENVKVQFIRLSFQLSKYFESLNMGDKAQHIKSELEHFQKIELSSVVLTELQKGEI